MHAPAQALVELWEVPREEEGNGVGAQALLEKCPGISFRCTGRRKEGIHSRSKGNEYPGTFRKVPRHLFKCPGRRKEGTGFWEPEK